MHIIPAIDLIGGKCVRLTRGDFSQVTEYRGDPLDVARTFQDHGLTRLHLVDLDGARESRIINYRTLEKIATGTDLHVDFGGGLRADEDVRVAFESGAAQVTGGSVAARHPERFLGWLDRYGPERVILGADAKGEKIAVSGWQETTEQYVYDFVRNYQQRGVHYVISTDVGQDGTLAGPAVSLYRQLQKEVPEVAIVASGGVGRLADLEALAELDLFGVIVGKAIYENKITLPELSRFLAP